MRWVDTNIFVRYLARDDPAKTAACLALFRRVAAGEEAVTTSEAVLAEVVYVLSSRSLYGVSPREIAERLTVILRWPGMRLPQKRVVLRALELYAQHRALDFEDALSVAHMEQRSIREILSYDRDFDRIPSVTRLEPEVEAAS